MSARGAVRQHSSVWQSNLQETTEVRFGLSVERQSTPSVLVLKFPFAFMTPLEQVLVMLFSWAFSVLWLLPLLSRFGPARPENGCLSNHPALQRIVNAIMAVCHCLRFKRVPSGFTLLQTGGGGGSDEAVASQNGRVSNRLRGRVSGHEVELASIGAGRE